MFSSKTSGDVMSEKWRKIRGFNLLSFDNLARIYLSGHLHSSEQVIGVFGGARVGVIDRASLRRLSVKG